MLRQNVAVCLFYVTCAILGAAYSLSKQPIIYPDSIGYQETAIEPFSLVNTLTSIRTPIYPLVLRVSEITTGSFAPALAFQSIIYIFSIHYFVFQLRRAGFKLWVAMLATAPLLFSPLLLKYGHTFLTETLATGISIFAFASLIPILNRKQTYSDLIVLSLATFLAILTRPAFVFIPPFAFLASLFLSRQNCQNNLFSRIKVSLIVFAVTFSPLLAYATIRLAVVGHFGLVSFGGTNVAGLALNPAILTTDVASGFQDKETRAAAQAILQKREELLASGIPNLPDAPRYLLDENQFSKQPMLQTWSAAYNISCWEVAVPAIASHLGVPETRGTPTWPQINRTLSKVSREAILANPMPYMQWVLISSTETAKKFFRTEPLQCKIVTLLMLAVISLALWPLRTTIFQPQFLTEAMPTAIAATLLSLLLFSANYAQVLTTFFFIVNGTISPVLIPGLFLAYAICTFPTNIIRSFSPPSNPNSHFVTILSAAAMYFLSGLLLVVSVEEPLERYILAILPPFSVGMFLGLSLACDYLLTRILSLPSKSTAAN